MLVIITILLSIFLLFRNKKIFLYFCSLTLISEFLEEYLSQKKITLKYRTSNSEWLGMTYKEDLLEVKNKIKELKEKGEYPNNLWEE